MSQQQNPNAWKTFARLAGYLKDYKLAFFVAILGNLAYAGMDFLFLRSLEPLTDEAMVKGNMQTLQMAPFFIIGLLVFRGIASFISAYCMSWVGQNIVQRIRVEMVEHFMKLPSAFYDQTPSGSLVSKITYDTQQVAGAITDAITKLLREGGLIIYILVYLFMTSWKLASLFLLAAPVIGLIVNITSKRFKQISHRIQNAMGGITQNSQEIIEGYPVIKTFGGEKHELERFKIEAKRNRQQNIKMVITRAASVPIIQLIAGFSLALVIYYAGIELKSGQLSPGQFVAMLSMMMLMLKPLKIISNLNSIFQTAIAAAQSIFAILDETTEKDEGDKELDEIKGEILFDNISFNYPGSQTAVLKNISFQIQPGQKIALVGRSGSGKSTLVNLLLRFYTPTQGKILLDGTDICDLKLKNLRHHTSLVSQNVTLFNTSIANNIAYAAEGALEQEKLERAAKQANALDFIEKLEQGFDTLVGERGSKLSGGQKQRIAIARAVYKDAKIVILDEATSALDSESERAIQGAFERLTSNRTTLIIAHRLSTIEKADMILVLNDGEIVERGTHQQLLDKEGFYANLYQLQFKEKDA